MVCLHVHVIYELTATEREGMESYCTGGCSRVCAGCEPSLIGRQPVKCLLHARSQQLTGGDANGIADFFIPTKHR